MMRRLPNTWEEIYRIVVALLELKRSGELSGLWIDNMNIRVSVPCDPYFVRKLSWDQAARLARGQTVSQVMRMTRKRAA